MPEFHRRGARPLPVLPPAASTTRAYPTIAIFGVRLTFYSRIKVNINTPRTSLTCRDVIPNQVYYFCAITACLSLFLTEFLLIGEKSTNFAQVYPTCGLCPNSPLCVTVFRRHRFHWRSSFRVGRLHAESGIADEAETQDQCQRPDIAIDIVAIHLHSPLCWLPPGESWLVR